MPKLFPGWAVVGATAFALIVSGTTFAAATFGLLTAHLGAAFHWSQAEMSPGLSIFLISATVAVPFVGRLSDRFGSRKVALAGLISMAAAVASGALMNHSILSLYAFYVAVGLTGAFTNPVAYMRAISLWFDRKRGLAIGLAVAGQGIGGTILPVVIQELAASIGWRGALLAIAAFMVLAVAPVVFLFVRDDPAQDGQVADGVLPGEGVAIDDATSGLTMAEALRRPVFWLILLALGLFGFTMYAMTGNLVYVLVHAQGLSLRQVAILQSISGLALLVGRIIFGWFMDRFHAPVVGAFGVLLATAGMIMLLTVSGFGSFAILRSVMLGAAGGAETDLLTLLVGRYFGKKALAEIYSWHNVAFLVGAAAGPPIFGAVMALTGGLLIPILAIAALTVLAAGVLLLLGPYPRFSAHEPAHLEEAALAPV